MHHMLVYGVYSGTKKIAIRNRADMNKSTYLPISCRLWMKLKKKQ